MLRMFFRDYYTTKMTMTTMQNFDSFISKANPEPLPCNTSDLDRFAVIANKSLDQLAAWSVVQLAQQRQCPIHPLGCMLGARQR